MRPHLFVTCTSLICASLFCAMPAAIAGELPTRKPGLWEIKMIVEGHDLPLRSIQQCTDAATDALMTTNFASVTGGACGEPEVGNSGGTITIDSTCALPGSSSRTHAVITGDFNSAYTVEVTAENSGGLPTAVPIKPSKTKMTLQARWAGPCKAGQRPGDIILPGGIRINVRHLKLPSGDAKP